MQTVIICRL